MLKTLSDTASAKLEAKDFEKIVGEKLSPHLRKWVDQQDFRFQWASPAQYQECRQKIRAELSSEIQKSGEERLEVWNRGWSENLLALDSLALEFALIPKYFREKPMLRWNETFIEPLSPHFEYKMLSFFRNWLFDKYLRDRSSVYEFGCGTGHNLIDIRSVNPRAQLWGLDWAKSSQDILKALKAKGLVDNLYAQSFDLFRPDLNFKLEKDCAVLTVASLEQTGERFHAFLDYLIQQKPKICLHLEPIIEFLDPKSELDRLSIEYFEKRNYLRGFLDELKRREGLNEIQILKAQRNSIGGLPIQAYSIVVWAPR